MATNMENDKENTDEVTQSDQISELTQEDKTWENLWQ